MNAVKLRTKGSVGRMKRRAVKHRRKRMKRRNYLLGGISLTMLIAVIIFGASQLFTKSPEAAKEVVVSSEIYPGLNLKTTTQEADTYTLFVSQPYTNIKEIDEPIEELINQQQNGFIREVKEVEDMLIENDFNAHFNIQTTTAKLADKVYSLELEAYQITGGASGATTIQPFVLDLNSNEQLTVDDMLKLEENEVNEIQELVYGEIQSNSEISEYIFEDLLAEALENPANWKVSANLESVNFHFNQGQIAAAAAGAIKVEVSMEEMIHYLIPGFAEKIGLEIPEKPVVLDPDGKYVALTFDDGPHADVTPRILEILSQHEAKATFYMLGSQVEYYPSIAKQVLDEGHEIGDHTLSHKDLTRLNQTQIKSEIQTSSNHILEATGSLPKSIRPPYGAFNDSVGEIVQGLELPVIMWSVDSLDWKSRDAQAINHEVMTTVHPGAIILLHDIHATTADALPQLLTNLENEGYEFLTVTELLEFGELEGIGPHFGIGQ